MRGLDYSWARPTGATIREAGFEFVMRYIPRPGTGAHGLDAAELADLRANGLAVGLVFESWAERIFDGYPAGAADAQVSQAALTKLGMPLDLPIYFACDVDTEPAMLALVDDYLRGCISVLGLARVGIYGEYDVIDHCYRSGSAAWFWQTYGWSRGRKHPERHLYQYLNGQTLNGGEVDYNEAYGEEQGLWKVEDEVNQTDFEDLVLSIYAGAEERYSENDGVEQSLWGQTKPRAERLEVALWRMRDRAQAARDEAQSLAQDVDEAQRGSAGGANGIPPHKHEMTIAISSTGGVIK